MSTIVLSAGGSGGHLFPAISARGGSLAAPRPQDRGDDGTRAARNIRTFFPGARIEIVPSATFGGGMSNLTAPFKILAGVAIGMSKLVKLKLAAVVGFGGYPSLPGDAGRDLRRHPYRDPRARTRCLRPRQSPRRQFGQRDRRRPRSIKRFAPTDMDKVTYTGNPVRLWKSPVMKDAPYDMPTATGPLNLLAFGGSQARAR